MNPLQISKYIFILFFVLICSFSTATAQEFITGADPLIKRIQTPARDVCYIFNHYIVVFPYVDPSQIQTSEDNLMVFRRRRDKKDFDCSLPEKEHELLRVQSGAFYGIYRHFVFVESGTGPDGRSIEFYDLDKRKQVYFAIYSPVAPPRIEKNALIFYKDLVDLRYKEDRLCPEAEKWSHTSLDYGFEQKTKVDLDTLIEKGIGKITCSERQ